MKRLCVLLLACALVFASDLIPLNKIENLADRFVNQRFGDYTLDETITYYGLDELPGAYALIYRNKENKPLTIVMGAKYTNSPVNEISKTLPRSKVAYEKILQKARSLGYGEPEFQKIYYFGPGNEYCAFRIGDKDILINACPSFLQVVEKSLLLENKPDPDKEYELATRRKWGKYFTTDNFASRDSNYIPDVPFIDWVYGCGPTSVSMPFYYWDSRGYGRLVDHFFTHWDQPEGEWNDCANVNRELAFAMGTDTLTGSSNYWDCDNAIITTANTWNGYSFSASCSGLGNSGNRFNFADFRAQIDAQRPCSYAVWNLYPYVWPPQAGHATTGVGYLTVPGDTFTQLHTTWSSDEPFWPLWTFQSGYTSYNGVVDITPGGAVTDNIDISTPLGGSLYDPEELFKGLQYYIRWTTEGSNIDHIDIWYAPGRDAHSYDPAYWTQIADNAANTGSYVWTCPDIDDSIRINLQAFNSSNNLLAAHGTYSRCRPLTVAHSVDVDIIGHQLTYGDVGDVQVVGTYAYVANGHDGLMVLDVSDSTLPDIVSELDLPGDAISIAANPPYVYIGDDKDTLRVISVSNPSNPSQVGKLALSAEAKDVFYDNDLVYIAERSEGLVIVDVSTPSAPSIMGQYNTTGFSYDVVVDGDYAYVADATRGARVIEVSDPQNPNETGYYDTNGISYGIAKAGTYVYVADGVQGIKVFDASSPDTLILLGTCDTPVMATKVQCLNNYLFVADGALGGLRIIDVSNPASPYDTGYFSARGAACNLSLFGGSLVGLADGIRGLLIIDQDIVGVSENQDIVPLRLSINISPSVSGVNNSLLITFNATKSLAIEMQLFDCTGRFVETLYRGKVDAGTNKMYWKPENISSGIYFVQTKANNFRDIQKLVFVK